MARNRPPKAFGSRMAARGLTVGRVNAPRSAEVGSFAARAVAMAYRKMAPTVERVFRAVSYRPRDSMVRRTSKTCAAVIDRTSNSPKEGRRNVRYQSIFSRVAGARPSRVSFALILFGNLPEGVVDRRYCGLPRVGFRQSRIFAGYKLSPSGIPSIPSFPQANQRVWAKRQQLFLAAEAVLQPPKLAALRRDEQKKAVRIEQLAGACRRRGRSEQRLR